MVVDLVLYCILSLGILIPMGIYFFLLSVIGKKLRKVILYNIVFSILSIIYLLLIGLTGFANYLLYYIGYIFKGALLLSICFFFIVVTRLFIYKSLHYLIISYTLFVLVFLVSCLFFTNLNLVLLVLLLSQIGFYFYYFSINEKIINIYLKNASSTLRMGIYTSGILILDFLFIRGFLFPLDLIMVGFVYLMNTFLLFLTVSFTKTFVKDINKEKEKTLVDTNNLILKEQTVSQYLSDSRIIEILQKIEELFENKKSYLSQGYTIANLSKDIGENKVYVSTAINFYNVSFTDLINYLRIKEAKVIFEKDDFKHYTIEAIGNMVGYKSKTSFNTYFKKYTGVTPKQYKTSIISL